MNKYIFIQIFCVAAIALLGVFYITYMADIARTHETVVKCNQVIKQCNSLLIRCGTQLTDNVGMFDFNVTGWANMTGETYEKE